MNDNGWLNERVTRSLALQLAQVQLDKTYMEARLSMLLETVQNVLSTTQWISSDDGVLTPVVGSEPLQILQQLVLNLN